MKVGETLFGNRLIRNAENGNSDACQRVLSKRNISVSAKVNAKHRQTGNTALHQACLNGHVITAKLLLEKGAKINANNKKGETPLMCACRNRHVEIATLLLTQYYDKNELGANINERNNAGWTALHYASSFLSRSKKDNTCIDMCYLLLKHGALINGTANNGNTPLHFAAHKGHLRLVKALMDRGANIEAVNKAGKTPVESANHGCKPQDLLDHHDVLVQRKKDLEKQQQQADAKDKSMSKSVSSSSLMKKETPTSTADSTGGAATADAIVLQHQQLHVEQEITMSQVKTNKEKMTTLMETLEQQSRQEQQLALALQRHVTALQDQIRTLEMEKVEMMEESVRLLEETVDLRQQVAKLQDLPRQKMDSLQLQKSKLMLIKNKQDQNQEPASSSSASSSAKATAEQPQQQQQQQQPDPTEASEDASESRDGDVTAPAVADSIVKAAEKSSTNRRSIPSAPSRRLSKSQGSNNKSVRMTSPKHGII